MKRCLLVLIALAAVARGSAEAKNPVVEIKTSMGTIKAELFEKEAPLTVKNFLKYVDDKHYDGTIFHRVMEDFMIQGGNFKKGFTNATTEKEYLDSRTKTGDPIKNESTNGLANKKYTLAMARTPKPNSATDQFFINVKDNAFLDRKNADDGVGYCVFGKVISGEDVVDKIKKVKTKTVVLKDKDGTPIAKFGNVPVSSVVIESVRRVKDK